MPAPPNLFAAVDLDRVAHRRRDPEWIADHLARSESRLLVLWRGRCLFSSVGVELHVADIPAPHHRAFAAIGVGPVLLGQRDGVAYFAIDISALDNPSENHLLAGGRFESPRLLLAAGAHSGAGQPGAGPQDMIASSHLIAYALALMHWHRQHRFCGACGAETLIDDAGHRRLCSRASCAREHFPTLSAAILALVHDGGDRLLLGRSARHPPEMRSILAGFREPGESLEDTVAREVFEEVGVRLAEIEYHSSQPWPFPGSLMVGFSARATSTELIIDHNELEEADWYDRDAVRAMVASPMIRVPPSTSLSGRLIRAWLET